MRVFLTGATGFVGSHITKEFIAHGHTVLGLARSDASAKMLTAMGAEVHRGVIEDLSCLKTGATNADAVIHCAFNHDFAAFLKSCETDRLAIEAVGSVLAGTAKPFIVTGGMAGLAGPGQYATEEHTITPDHPFPRLSEQTALALIPKGVNVSIMRLSQIHDTTKQGLVTFAIQTARAKGVSAYVGEGENRWSAAHINDVATLYRLALEKHETGAKWHAVGEEGVGFREIAEILGRQLNVPTVSIAAEKAAEHFGWWGGLVGADLVASSAITRKKLNWNPTGPGLLADLENLSHVAIAA